MDAIVCDLKAWHLVAVSVSEPLSTPNALSTFILYTARLNVHA